MAYGERAIAEAGHSRASLARVHPELPVLVIGPETCPQRDAGGRWAKLNLDTLSPFEQTLYLDADTRVRGDLSAGFRILADGYDLALAFSMRQGSDVLGNCGLPDRSATFEELACRDLLGLQAGVMFFQKGEAVSRLFSTWCEEWGRFRAMDQAALLRALARVPVRVWLLGRAWNGGELIEHRFGAARRGA